MNFEKYTPCYYYRSRRRIYLPEDDDEDDENRSNNNLCCCFTPTSAKTKYLEFTSRSGSADNKSQNRIRLFTGSRYYDRKTKLSTSSTTLLDEYLDPQSPVSIEAILAEQEEELDSYYSSPTEDAVDYVHYRHTTAVHSKDGNERNSVDQVLRTPFTDDSTEANNEASKSATMSDLILDIDDQAREEDARSLSEHRISAILNHTCTDEPPAVETQVTDRREQMLANVTPTDYCTIGQELVDVSIPSISSSSNIDSEINQVPSTMTAEEGESFQKQELDSQNQEQRKDESIASGDAEVSVTAMTKGSEDMITSSFFSSEIPKKAKDSYDAKDDVTDNGVKVNTNDSAVVMMESVADSLSSVNTSKRPEGQKFQTTIQQSYLVRSSSLPASSKSSFPATSLPRTPSHPIDTSFNSRNNHKNPSQQENCVEVTTLDTSEAVEATAVATAPSPSLIPKVQPQRSRSNNDNELTSDEQQNNGKRRPSLLASAQNFLLNDKKFMEEFTEKLSFIKKNITITNEDTTANIYKENFIPSSHRHETPLESSVNTNQQPYHQNNYQQQQQRRLELLAAGDEEGHFMDQEDDDRTNIDEELIELSRKVVQNVRTLGEGLKTNSFRLFNNISTKLKTLQEEYIVPSDNNNFNDNSISI